MSKSCGMSQNENSTKSSLNSELEKLPQTHFYEADVSSQFLIQSSSQSFLVVSQIDTVGTELMLEPGTVYDARDSPKYVYVFGGSSKAFVEYR